MHIFLDTTVTFADPFFKKNFNRSLLKLTRDYKDITLYMSEIVYKETKRHFLKNVKEYLQEQNKVKSKLQNYRIGFFEESRDSNSEIEKTVKNLLSDFENFYHQLQSEELLKILNCPHSILPELIERSVNRIKPFKENKSEFRDAATWLTYVQYSEENCLEDCYLITENVADFFDEKKEKIHSDLLEDSTNFKPFLTLAKLMQDDIKVKAYIEEKQGKEKAIQEWIEKNNINEEYILGYFGESSYNGIFNEVFFLCSNYITSHNIKLADAYHDGVSTVNGIDIKEIQDCLIEVIAEEILVSGELIIEASCDFTDSTYEKNSEVIKHTTPFSMDFILPFSFSMKMDKSITNLQMEEPKPFGKIEIDPTLLF